MNLTLNDFRNVLGKVNDGNIVFTRDGKGIEKANYGNAFLNLFRSVRRAPSDPTENAKVRSSLVAAIQQSVEGKVISDEQFRRIYSALGMTGDKDVEGLSKSLTRRELMNVMNIVDDVTDGGDKLIDQNVELLKNKGLYAKGVADGIKKAISKAQCFTPASDVRSGVRAMRAMFGADLHGYNPSDIEKFVRLNRSVIRAQVFDRLYWNSKNLPIFTAEDHLDTAFDTAAVPIQGTDVTDAFKEVVGSLMVKLAARERVLTRAETFGVMTMPMKFVDNGDLRADGPEGLWKGYVEGPGEDGKSGINIAKTFDSLFGESVEKLGKFERLQVECISRHIRNKLCSSFCSILPKRHFKLQDALASFEEQHGSLLSMLNRLAADIESVGQDAGVKFLERVADSMGAVVLARDVDKDKEISDQDAFDEAMKALDDAAKAFSTEHMVEDVVNKNFAYLEEKAKEAAFKFVLEEVVGGEGKEGATDEQRELLREFQRAVLTGSEDAAGLRERVMDELFEPISRTHADNLAKSDKNVVMAMRSRRNECVLADLAKSVPGYEGKDEAGKAAAVLEMKLQVLGAKLGIAKLFEMGITGSERNLDIKRKGGGSGDPIDEDALKLLDDNLIEMDDEDFGFFSQYVAKGLYKADEAIRSWIGFHQLHADVQPPFQNALKDGLVKIEDIPVDAIDMLKCLMTADLNSLISVDNPFRETISLTGFFRDGKGGGRFAEAALERIRTRVATAFNVDSREWVSGGKSTNLQMIDLAQMGLGKVRGLGTHDLGRILKVIGEMGIDISKLDGADAEASVDVYEKVLCLSTIAAMNGSRIDGLAEFTQRVFGKSFDKVDYVDVLSVLNKQGKLQKDNWGAKYVPEGITIEDPLKALHNSFKKPVEFFSGRLSVSELGLSPGDAAALLKAAKGLGASSPVAAVSIGGAKMTLSRLDGGELNVTMKNLPLRAAFDVSGFIRLLEDVVVSNPGAFAVDVVDSVLPAVKDVKSGEVSIVRARELYAKTAAAKTGLPTVMFSSYSTEDLRDIAIKAVKGEFTSRDLPDSPPSLYNSAVMLEMQDNLLKTPSREVSAKVRMPSPDIKSMDVRDSVGPDGQTVRNIVADLFLNGDTWAFDKASARPDSPRGVRMQRIVQQYASELLSVFRSLSDENGGVCLSGLPKDVRAAVKDVLLEIGGVCKVQQGGYANGEALGQYVAGLNSAVFSDIEARMDAIADKLVNEMQEKVNNLFAPRNEVAAAKPDWQKSFTELAGKEGIDVGTRQGKFTMKVLTNYFINAAAVDKRAMLSAFIRNTDEKSTDSKLVAELLKGAGPLLQKMLQGLPMSSFDAETQVALKDMKSRLLPISDDAVKAQLLELVRSSGGHILSIEVKRSLGAATVGQAFLCNIKTKDHPQLGEECVVKLLRPNVDTAILREKAMIDKLVGDDESMKATFDGQYRKILEEFDLTLEATNIGIGAKVYENAGDVATLHSMQVLDGTNPTMTAMIVKKADGATFDGTIANLRAEAEQLLDGPDYNVDKQSFKAKDAKDGATIRRKLVAKAGQLCVRRNQLLDVTKAWFQNALFGNGFFHGDLHGGNLMQGETGTTFIDFGNCSRLSKAEQTSITLLLATTVSGDVDKAVDNFRNLLTKDGKDAFNDAINGTDKAGPRLSMDALRDILRRGNAFDLMSRLQAFIAAVQGADVPIPASLQNFVQSYIRLSDIVTDIDHAMDDFKVAARSVYWEAPALDAVEGEPKVISHIKELARAYIGSSDTPYSEFAVRKAVADAEAYVRSEDGKAEIRDLSHDVGKLFSVVKPFCEAMRTFMVDNADRELNVTEQQVYSHGGQYDILLRLEELEKEGVSADNPKKYEELSEKGKAACDKIGELLGKYAADARGSLLKSMALEYGGSLTFKDMPALRGEDMPDVCCGVIEENVSAIGGAVLMQFMFDAKEFAGRVVQESDTAKAAAVRSKNIGPVLAEANEGVGKEERLTGRDFMALTRATGVFYVPTPRPDAEEGWARDSGKRQQMLDAIVHNLSRGAQALNRETLAPHQARLAALNFALMDGRLYESISGLSDDDYGELMSEVNNESYKSHGESLRAALGAIREAKGMYETISKAKKEP